MGKIFIFLFFLIGFSSFAQEVTIKFFDDECSDSNYHVKVVDIVKVKGWEYFKKTSVDPAIILKKIKRCREGSFYLDSSGITFTMTFHNKKPINAYVLIGEVKGGHHIYIVSPELKKMMDKEIMIGEVYDLSLCCKKWNPRGIMWLNLSYRIIYILINYNVVIFFYGPDYGTYCYSKQLIGRRISN